MIFLRLDSVGGASGDMILGALVGLGIDLTTLHDELATLFDEPFRLETTDVASHGVHGSKLTVNIDEVPNGPDATEIACHSHHDDGHHHDDHHHDDGHHYDDHHHHHHDGHHDSSVKGHCHRSFADIRSLIAASSLPEEVKSESIAVFEVLAQAEGAVHSKNPEEVRFHEVGAVDSIIDIVGSVWAIHRLGIDAISLSPLPVGGGQVVCAHGVYPVPAPATAILLRDYAIPIIPGGPSQEMVTPTAAALLAVWKRVPDSAISSAILKKTVHSFGHRVYEDRPNLLRASIYETVEKEAAEFSDSSTDPLSPSNEIETLVRLETNLDDASGERLAAAADAIFRAGALDVWFVPILMKKGRPGQRLGVLTTPTAKRAVLDAIFRQTGTFGVSEEMVRRHAISRRWESVESDYGPVRIKIGSRAGEDIVFAPEFEEVIAAANASGVPFETVYRNVTILFEEKRRQANHKNDGR